MLDKTLVLAGALAVIGCASAPVPVTRSPESPAHPAAAEAATPPLRPELGSADEASAPPAASSPRGAAAEQPASHGDHTALATKATAYTCPMHPEVEKTEAGSCPVCGMTLVPRKPKLPAGGQR